MIRLFAVFTLWALFGASAALSQELSGLARFEPEGSVIRDRGRQLEVTLNLSQGVPMRVFTLDNPRRLVIDFREVDWAGADAEALEQSDAVSAVRFGGFRPGWSRLVADLDAPMSLETALITSRSDAGGARVSVVMRHTDAAAFAAKAGPPETGNWPQAEKPRVQPDKSRVLIVLDPGHGGIDPGATRDGHEEKALMLQFAREIADALGRVEGVDVLLTREDDSFVSLERRVAMAHQAGASLFLSLHADALGQGHGHAHGATVHTLSDDASDEASALLAERHDRADMLSGVDLSGQDDVVADVLLDLARAETQPRSDRLAKALIEGLEASNAPLNRRAHRAAAFSVLKAADIPSVLLEIGFMSSDRDFANITNTDWRRTMAEAIRDGIIAWVIQDEAFSKVVRQ